MNSVKKFIEAVAWTVVGPDGKSSIGGWQNMKTHDFWKEAGVLREGHRYAYAYAAPVAAALGIDLVALREIASDLSHSAKVDDYMPPQQIAFIESIRDRLLALIDANHSGALPTLPDDFSESKDWRAGSYGERVEWLMDTVRSQREHIAALLDSPQEASDA